ncbi:MAG: maleylpyruvate isomerase family mycothiol-dependent enzyme [Streptosporangiales bacterium]|nr:maleylpyruvate isomerase family mycothiol-dependent enzyme [Streptosporangiales bacterium]
MPPSKDETIAKLRDVWGSLDRLADGLLEEEWELPTDCPGWTVRDQLAHLLTGESLVSGESLPDHKMDPLPAYVRNDLGEFNEHAIDHWRTRPIHELIAAWHAMVRTRLADLEAATDEDLAKDSWTPVGPGTVLDFLQVRILDHWVHEQDIRRATGRAGGMEGSAAAHTIDRLLIPLPRVVAKSAAAPDGASVLLEIAGPVRRQVAVSVAEGRGQVVQRLSGAPTVRIRMDTEAFLILATGRRDPETVLPSGVVTLEGDTELGAAVVRNLNIMI